MRSTTLFGIYAAVIIALLGGLGGITLFSLEKTRWWDARTQLAQASYGLHLKLEANIYRLFKQHGDALLIGDRDGGEEEDSLRDAIAQNLVDIRKIIASEIQMAGDEEIEELELLESIEADIRSVNAAMATLTASGDPIDSFIQIERLAALLDGDIDVELDRKINAALEEELEEVEEVLAEATAFRARNETLVYILLIAAGAVLIVGLLSFDGQIRQPIIRLQNGLDRLRSADYSAPVNLGGSKEFRDLGLVLNGMTEGLAAREVSRAEQRKHLETTVATRTEELQKLIDKLEAGEEQRKRLMADISHELRTPLAIILGEADVTLRTTTSLSAGVSDALARIRDSAKHTNQIVDDMLTVARFEAGQLRLDRKETDLRKIVHDAVAMFPGSVAVVSPDTRVMAPVDEVRLRQSVLALLQNARRYGGSTISVMVETNPSDHVVSVEDDGPGLSAAEKSQAFDRFFRGSNASGQGIEGSGLGLPVVKSIIEAHGGTVTLHTAESGGLRVVISLPKHPAQKAVPSETSLKSA
ncbi:HAMP domain-containing histidine kinase [Tateyamaria omphalii]|uniref:sensor histidine kinase n=1 Tax=Tateyamaria omphalii TaxID=299262 RepID=UPI001C99D2AE|nr:HAMP domain-containing sensor histidine kinase [Tateyamaria omphalii]MBY5935074.1 HAMP domain-containing histidine kinase [Tateyamaria omphalii]